jgi:hypothetical protein
MREFGDEILAGEADWAQSVPPARVLLLLLAKSDDGTSRPRRCTLALSRLV